MVAHWSKGVKFIVNLQLQLLASEHGGRN